MKENNKMKHRVHRNKDRSRCLSNRNVITEKQEGKEYDKSEQRQDSIVEIRHQRVYSRQSPKSLLDGKRGPQWKFMSQSKTNTYNITKENGNKSKKSKIYKRCEKENINQAKENQGNNIDQKKRTSGLTVPHEQRECNGSPSLANKSQFKSLCPHPLPPPSTLISSKSTQKASSPMKVDTIVKTKDNEKISVLTSPPMKNNLKAIKNKKEKWDKVIYSLGEALGHIAINKAPCNEKNSVFDSLSKFC